MMHTIVSLDIVNHMSKFDEHVTNKPLARAIRQYMEMVLEMLMYIRAIRTGNWMLYLDTTEAFVKYFFAHDKLNYAWLTPVYLADMKALGGKNLWKVTGLLTRI